LRTAENSRIVGQMSIRGGFAVLWLGVCAGCGGGPAPIPVVPNSNAAPAPPSSLSLPVDAFAAPSANPGRKAKLLALAPQLDALFRARLAELAATGAAIGIVLEGEVVYLRGFGVRDTTSQVAVDADTVFRIGSVSKTITALAILRLRDQGKLSLDAPAASYLPELRALSAPTKDSPPITIRHLLTMTSGLAYDDQWGAVTYGKSDAELHDYLERGVPLVGAAGERYRYSNLGFALLGKIAARVSGKSFEQYVASEIFAPLGLMASGYVTDSLPADRLATGYFRDGTQLVPEPIESDGVFAPAGGAYTTIRDLARYAAFQLAAYPPRDDAETGPVRRSTLREMHAGEAWGRFGDDLPIAARKPDGTTSLVAMSYGLGWSQLTTCAAEAMVQHGGYEPGYYASIRLVPRHGIGVVALSTTENHGQMRTFELVMALLRSAGVLDVAAPAASTAMLAARENVTRLLAKWQPELVENTFDAQSLQFSFLRNLRPDFERMAREHGVCHPDGDVIPMGPMQGRFRLACERGSIDFVGYLAPGVPARLQSVEYRQNLPIADAERAFARALVAALNGGALAPTLFAAGADVPVLQKRLARWHGSHGTCQLDAELAGDGKGQASFRLRCAEGPLELTLRLEPKTALIVDVSAARPREYGAVCAE
jgi:CubicO group peptidase (beta-lactamase class C family)